MLRAQSNDLTSLPGEMERLRNLEIFDVSDNLLTGLPESICKLPAIKEVHVNDNKLTVGFPKAWENLRARATLAYHDQSSVKDRPPQDRPKKPEESKPSPKSKRKGKGKGSPKAGRRNVIKSAPPAAS